MHDGGKEKSIGCLRPCHLDPPVLSPLSASLLVLPVFPPRPLDSPGVRGTEAGRAPAVHHRVLLTRVLINPPANRIRSNWKWKYMNVFKS